MRNIGKFLVKNRLTLRKNSFDLSPCCHHMYFSLPVILPSKNGTKVKKYLACMRLINALSFSILKCETPPASYLTFSAIHLISTPDLMAFTKISMSNSILFDLLWRVALSSSFSG